MSRCFQATSNTGYNEGHLAWDFCSFSGEKVYKMCKNWQISLITVTLVYLFLFFSHPSCISFMNTAKKVFTTKKIKCIIKKFALLVIYFSHFWMSSTTFSAENFLFCVPFKACFWVELYRFDKILYWSLRLFLRYKSQLGAMATFESELNFDLKTLFDRRSLLYFLCWAGY